MVNTYFFLGLIGGAIVGVILTLVAADYGKTAKKKKNNANKH